MSYYLAPSLSKLRGQANTLWPDRGKASDGWIGDPSHQARKSGHNPDYSSGGVVRALDIDVTGIDVDAFLEATIRDPRTSYVIYNRRIWGGTFWRKYDGANPHTKHVHVEIKSTKAAEADHDWNLAPTIVPVSSVKPIATKPASKPTKAPAGKGWPESPLPLSNAHTGASHAAWVELLAAIGYKDKDLGLALQKWLRGLKDPRDGKPYYETRWALDGNFQAESVKALQRKLYDTRDEAGNRLYNGVADGKRKGLTVRGEIRYLNLKSNRGV